ncbi:hypothetical protein INT08_06245 [Prosthecochloris sp. N3]|uniref:DUF2029 domain-containing protein n=1 Tax=Prosthecochloris ethylica TaxID=2743976 RepID=A0ABR9XSH9_9CHLB|nr:MULTISPECIES: hypothetical protein [Prosthecochloris]MBF0586877.1 hypothetical protein [Prosthecochloris ethylica]MBF0636775.1 hypothetical protein [Prosthecochloris ethylica]NUK47991.1 hypothetical protein [Prosthecochloris ethylica]RNA64284.1 hypothetical protein CR163_002895 [Prosthecochloris sp. ZM_2]
MNNSHLFNIPAGTGKVLLWSGILLLVTTASPSIHGDGAVRFSAVNAVMEGDPVPAIKYSLLQPLLSLPLAYAASLFGTGVKQTVSMFNILVFLMLAKTLFDSLSRIYSSAIARHTLLLLVGASMLPHHLQHYYGEVLSTLAITSGTLLHRRSRICSVLLIAVGLANTPAMLPAGLAGALVLVRKQPLFLGAVLIAALLTVAENTWKYGLLTDTGYLSESEKGASTIMPYSGLPGFSYPLFFGVLSIVLSFGKGIVFYIPGLMLLLRKDTWKRIRAWNIYGLALGAFMITLVLVYAKWWAWYGGNFWGPRFFLVFVIPATIALSASIGTASSVMQKAAFALLLTFSFWVGIDGVIFGQNGMGLCWENNYKLEMLCWYAPEFSALWRPFVTHNPAEFLESMISDKRFLYSVWQLATYAYFMTLLIRSREHRTENGVSSPSTTTSH